MWRTPTCRLQWRWNGVFPFRPMPWEWTVGIINKNRISSKQRILFKLHLTEEIIWPPSLFLFLSRTTTVGGVRFANRNTFSFVENIVLNLWTLGLSVKISSVRRHQPRSHTPRYRGCTVLYTRTGSRIKHSQIRGCYNCDLYRRWRACSTCAALRP